MKKERDDRNREERERKVDFAAFPGCPFCSPAVGQSESRNRAITTTRVVLDFMSANRQAGRIPSARFYLAREVPL